MNYYERYSGDYARDTAHLSLAEHGAYTLMLDAYYSTERPFPPELAPLYRVCRAMSKPEQACVRSVADQFFPIGPDGMRHNRRADRDIAKAQPRIAVARANGAHGGRPKKLNGNPVGYQIETQQKPSGLLNVNPAGNPVGYPAETQPGEAFHHAPEELKPKTLAQPDGFASFWSAYPRKKSKGDAVKAWTKLHPDAAMRSVIAGSIAEQKTWPEWTRDNGQFIPYPASWLNARGWEDELMPASGGFGRVD